MKPELWIVAGPNGAGKTTLVSKEPVADLLPKVVFWNPDELARQDRRALVAVHGKSIMVYGASDSVLDLRQFRG